MEQLELDTDATFAHALSHACTDTGRKRVACKLWPELDVQSAITRLDHCFDPDRREKLSLEQVELILNMARDNDVHVAVNYLADTLRYERPKALNPDTERDRIRRQFIAARNDIARLAQQMERLQQDD